MVPVLSLWSLWELFTGTQTMILLEQTAVQLFMCECGGWTVSEPSSAILHINVVPGRAHLCSVAPLGGICLLLVAALWTNLTAWLVGVLPDPVPQAVLCGRMPQSRGRIAGIRPFAWQTMSFLSISLSHLGAVCWGRVIVGTKASQGSECSLGRRRVPHACIHRHERPAKICKAGLCAAEV
jgi:hypothetical protein